MRLIDEIKKAVDQQLEKLGLGKINYEVSHPTDDTYGDYVVNVAMVGFGQLKSRFKSPRELAEAIVSKLGEGSLKKIASKIVVADPGFINISIKNDILITQVNELLKKKKIGRAGVGKIALVEYSSPNIAKPFTVGHLRSTIIGEAVANLLEENGWQVLRDNHLGDWGTQFGKQIYAVKTWGDEDKICRSSSPVKELVALYIKFHQQADKDDTINDKARQWFKKLEDGDQQARQLWQKCVDWSWQSFSKIYDRLGVKFSLQFDEGRGLGESFFRDKMAEVIEELRQKGLMKKGEEGAELVFFKNDGYPPAMILKKDGSSLYITRDLATDKYRKKKFKPDLIVNEVGLEQKLYFKQLFEIERLLGWFKKGQRVHLGHGLYRFKQGKMSTRKGSVVWLEKVLDEAKEKALALVKEKSPNLKNKEKVAEAIGLGALKWNDLKGAASRDIVFEWQEILNMQGNSGPYLQYSYARAKSVLDKAKTETDVFNEKGLVKLKPAERDLLRFLARFGEVVEEAGQKLMPNLLANYLFNLAQRFNAFYNQCPILKTKPEIRKRRLWLTKMTAKALKKGLDLLGIETLSKM